MQDAALNTSGQCCLATLSGVSLANVVRNVGRLGFIGAQELIRATRLYGFECSDGMLRISGRHPFPRCAYLYGVPRFPAAKKHWILVWGGELFDPLNQASGRDLNRLGLQYDIRSFVAIFDPRGFASL